MKRIAASIMTVALACLGMAVDAKAAGGANDRFMVAQISPSNVAGSSITTYHVSVTNDILSGPNHFIRNVSITVPAGFTGSGPNGAFIHADASSTSLWKVQ